jgi:hypothetical protein
MGAFGARYIKSTCKTSYRIIFNRKEGGLSEAKGGMRSGSRSFPYGEIRFVGISTSTI